MASRRSVATTRASSAVRLWGTSGPVMRRRLPWWRRRGRRGGVRRCARRCPCRGRSRMPSCRWRGGGEPPGGGGAGSVGGAGGRVAALEAGGGPAGLGLLGHVVEVVVGGGRVPVVLGGVAQGPLGGFAGGRQHPVEPAEQGVDGLGAGPGDGGAVGAVPDLGEAAGAELAVL